MSDVVERAEAALEGVTEGPWVSWKQRQHSRDQGGIYRGNVVSDATKQIIVTQTGNVANSEFIAAARQLVPELVAELKTTRAQLEAEKAVCADISELLVKVGLYATKGNSGPENRAVILRGFGPGANEGP